MKKQNLFVLLASLGMLTACGGNPGGTKPPKIVHGEPFVSTVENASLTRNFREEFDSMVEDFSGATPTGTTTGNFTESVLRVFVDSQDQNEPTSINRAIYKHARDGMRNYDGIGFKMRIVGNKALKLSNLILALRADDQHADYEVKLSDGLDPDGNALPELTEQFQDIVFSRQQSLDGDVKYKNLDGSDSEIGLLDDLVGFHLYASDQECSAIVEIKEFFVTDGAGARTTLDNFARVDINETAPGAYWNGSTGFIQQKGVTLSKDQTYTTKDIELGEYQNVVVSFNGNTTGLKINGVDYSALKDSEGTTLTGAVNGAFYNYVINLTNSGLSLNQGKLTFTANEGVIISKIFLTNLQNEVPITEYPKIDIDGAVYFDKFNNRTMEAGTLDGDYDKSAADPKVADAGFNFILSYHGSDKISIADGKLEIAGTEDYANYKAGSKVSFAGKKYMVISAKGDISLLRIALDNGKTPIYGNQWVAGPGLATIPTGGAYAYDQGEGYKLYIVDLARSGYDYPYSDIVDLYYTGAGLSVDSIFFTDEYKAEATVEEEVMLDADVAVSSPDYTYVCGTNDLPSDVKYIHVQTDATVEDLIRFEGSSATQWLNASTVIDIDGKVVADGSTDYVIDLEASGLAGTKFHVHSSIKETRHFRVAFYRVFPKVQLVETELFNGSVDALEEGSTYHYITELAVPETAKYLHIETTANAGNEIRFNGGQGDKWPKDGDVIDIDGKAVAQDATDYIIDLEASGLKSTTIHVHSTQTTHAFTFKASAVEEQPLPQYLPTELTDRTIDDITGWVYGGGFALHAGVQFFRIRLSSTSSDQDLSSFRIEGKNGAKWAKDNALIGQDGKAISGTTTVTEEGIEIVIDAVASGLKDGVNDAQFVHFHWGDLPGSHGNITYTVEEITVGGSYVYTLVKYAG